MSLRPWHLLLATAALLVPLQAGALSSGGGGGLAVDATLDHCGVSGGGVSCKIDASWSGVGEADRYSATVTLADGSVRDLGAVGTGPGGGATSFWVPYTGAGVYTVTVSAWGADPEGKEAELEAATAEARGSDRAGGEKARPDGEEAHPEGEEGAEGTGRKAEDEALDEPRDPTTDGEPAQSPAPEGSEEPQGAAGPEGAEQLEVDPTAPPSTGTRTAPERSNPGGAADDADEEAKAPAGGSAPAPPEAAG